MYYEFYCPVKVISGDNAVFSLPSELDCLSVRKPALVTDGGVIEAGLLKHIEKSFGDVGISMPPVFSEVPEESSMASVEDVYSFFMDNGCDSIVAMGGGSVIDTAKALNLFLSGGKEKLEELVGVDVVERKGKPFVAVPTTAGTGSEVTSVAVIFDEDRGC